MRSLAALALVAACASDPGVVPPARGRFPAVPTPVANPTTAAKVELGRLLFHDPLLSRDRMVACATCHGQIWGLSDGLARSVGLDGVGPAGTGRHGPNVTRRNASTLWNVAYRANLFWDGRAASLEAQALAPLRDPAEMGRDPDDVARDLAAIPAYVSLFRAAFTNDPAPVTSVNMVRAIAAFERTLVSDYAPYDRYVDGDTGALDARATRGLALFAALRCGQCHTAPMFESERYETSFVEGISGVTDEGRYEVTGDPADRGRYRVPTLRNVGETFPYFHNGAVRELGDAVALEAAHRPGARALTPAERDDVTAFLRAGLTDMHAQPERPDVVPSGLMVPADGYRIPR